MYAVAQDKWMILISRFLAGAGLGKSLKFLLEFSLKFLIGSAGLAQAYIGKVTTPEDRGTSLSRQLEASSLGYAFGPG